MKRDDNEEVKRGMRTNPQADGSSTRVYRPRTLAKRNEPAESDSTSENINEQREYPESRASEHRHDRPLRHSDNDTRSYKPRTYHRPEAAEPQHEETQTEAPKHDGYSWSEMPYASKNQGNNEQRDGRQRDSDRRDDDFRRREARPFDDRPFSRQRDDREGFRPRFAQRDDRQRGFNRHDDSFRRRGSFGSHGYEQRGNHPDRNQHNQPPRSRKKVFNFTDDLAHLTDGPQLPPQNTINETDAAKGLIRLNKYVANSGLCSRREADEHIQNGQITVNGKVVSTLGAKVQPTDEICFRGKKLEAERRVYILMNKPKDYVTTVDDPHATHTVMELLEGACPERIYPVGRLDRNSTGVLLFTNDGDLTKKLTHPSSRKRKIYQVTLDRKVSEADLEKIFNGIELDGERIAVDAVDYTVNSDGTEIGIELHSGQNRVVRRLFESLNYRVDKLDRVYFAGLTKKNLPRGTWRFLEPKEINMLKMGRF